MESNKEFNNINKTLNKHDRLVRKENINMAALGYIIEFIETNEKSIFVKESKERFKRRKTEYPNVLEHLKAFYMSCVPSGDGFGVVNTAFRKPHDPYGRLNAVKSISLATITRPVRHAISGDIYYDCDVVNCFPVLLSQYCSKQNIECDRLHDLVEDRERFFKDIIDLNPTLSRDSVKGFILAMLHGGGDYEMKTVKPSRALTGFYNEMKKINKQLCDLPENKPLCIQVIKSHSKYKSDTPSNRSSIYNFEGKVTSRILQNIENDVLCVMESVFVRYGVPLETIVPIHDGCQVRRDLLKHDIQDVFREIEDTVFKTMGYKIDLLEKPMDYHTKCGFTIPKFSKDDIKDLCFMSFKIKQQDIVNITHLFDRNDLYDFTNFRNEIRTTEFESPETMIKYLIETIPRVVCLVDKPQGWLVKVSQCDVEFLAMKQLPLCYVYWIEIDDKGNVRNKNSKLVEIITSPQFHKFLQPIKTLIFEPDLTREYPFMYNTFLGFEGMTKNFNPLTEDELTIIDPLLHHIKVVLSNGDPDINDYILSYFAQIIQKPHIKTLIFMIFYSEAQQVGKNIILKFLAKYVFGHRYALERTGMSEILDEKNADFETCILCVVNEIILKDGYHTDWDRVKDLITSDRRRLRKMYCDAIEIGNYTNYIGTTNNKHSVRVEGDNDSRVCAFECNPIYRNNRQYFTNLSKCFTREHGELMYRFLWNYSIERDLRDIPHTTLKDEMASEYKHCLQRYLENIDALDIQTRPKTIPNGWKRSLYMCVKDGWIHIDGLYKSYKEWCKENGEKTYKKNWVINEIGKYRDIKASGYKTQVKLYEKGTKFYCSLCEYRTDRKDNFDRHKMSQQHLLNYNHQ